MTTTPQRILVAEDDRLLGKAATAALRRSGFEVDLAVNGEAALASARAVPPDLILLDVIMPGIQGFEVLARLKADPATRAIPVVMLSNLGQDTDVEEAMRAGASAYLVKANLRLDELALKVRAVLGGELPA
jgi:DNA-binding response OmpR family regulator